MLLFHIALAADWNAARDAGHYRVSTPGLALSETGFIHACYADQVLLAAELAFGHVTEPLVLLVIDPERLPVPVLVEPVPGVGLSFPRIRGALALDAVTNTHDLHRGTGPRDRWQWDFAEYWKHPVPDRVPIGHEPDFRTDLIGRYDAGLFLAGFGGITYLHLFDADGRHQDSRIGLAEAALGAEASVDDLMARLQAEVNALPGRAFGDIAVRLFSVEHTDGRLWGLFDETVVRGFPHVELEPDTLGFNPPWDGLYDT
jgi:formate hydrogenlyase regulatory protein HycA